MVLLWKGTCLGSELLAQHDVAVMLLPGKMATVPSNRIPHTPACERLTACDMAG